MQPSNHMNLKNMKKFLAFGLIAFTALLLNSCQEDPNSPDEGNLPEKANIRITSETTDSTLCFLFTSDKADITYAIGAMTESELAEIGGEEALAGYITDQLNTGTAVIKTQPSESYKVEDLKLSVNYYAWAVQINEGAIYGDIVVSEAASVARQYFEYLANYYYMAPFAISGNGRYVCGTDDQKTSYIIDLETGEVEEDIDDINIRTIDNNGVGYGYGLRMQACTYQNGEITPLHSTGTGNIFDVTGDGSLAGGYQGYDAIIYRNGQIESLSIEGDCLYGPYDNTAEDWYHEDNPWIYSTAREGCVTSIGKNGVCGGYLVEDIWSIDLSCYWDAQGNIHIFGNENAEYNIADRWFYGQIGTSAVMVSPSGKYVACTGNGSLIIFDGETGERTDIQAQGAAISSVAAITDNCHVYFSNGYIYTPERGFELLEYYVEDIYGKTFQVSMSGTLIGVSDDEKRILIAASLGDGTYAARVFFM